MNSQETPFKPGWVSVSLPGYRGDSFGVFAYNMLPPLGEDAFYGAFQWLNPLDRYLEATLQPHRPSIKEREQLQENLKHIVADAESMNLHLPAQFLKFMSNPYLQDQMPFSHYDFDLSQNLRKSSLFNDCYFIRFLSESYGPLSWHLYLTPNGNHCVIASLGADLSDENPLNRWFATGKQITIEWVMENTFFCAPNFEEFLYRFWFEYHIFLALSEGRELSEEQKRYVTHYTP